MPRRSACRNARSDDPSTNVVDERRRAASPDVPNDTALARRLGPSAARSRAS
jgi:hypothetical protein